MTYSVRSFFGLITAVAVSLVASQAMFFGVTISVVILLVVLGIFTLPCGMQRPYFYGATCGVLACAFISVPILNYCRDELDLGVSVGSSLMSDMPYFGKQTVGNRIASAALLVGFVAGALVGSVVTYKPDSSHPRK